jgi:hypothetical protein
MISYLKREAKRLENELMLVDHPAGLATFEMAFLRYHATGFKPFEAMRVLADEIEGWDKLTDLQLKTRALTVLKKPSAKTYLARLTARVEDLGVASMLEAQMWLTSAIRTPIDMIDGNSPLCQKKVVTVRTSKDGTVTETTTLESISKMDAAKTLIRMKGWDAPVKVDVNHRGGVMLVPMVDNLDDWQKNAGPSQAKLMADAVNI